MLGNSRKKILEHFWGSTWVGVFGLGLGLGLVGIGEDGCWGLVGEEVCGSVTDGCGWGGCGSGGGCRDGRLSRIGEGVEGCGDGGLSSSRYSSSSYSSSLGLGEGEGVGGCVSSM